jgi:hypothetical protein
MGCIIAVTDRQQCAAFTYPLRMQVRQLRHSGFAKFAKHFSRRDDSPSTDRERPITYPDNDGHRAARTLG